MTTAKNPPARERNPRGSGARLRDDIVDAAIAIVDESEDAATLSLRGVARRAGVSAPAIYPHFADLAAVTEAVLAQSFHELQATIAAAAAATSDPREALLAACGAYVAFGRAHPGRYRAMFAPDGFAPDAVAVYHLIEELVATAAAADRSAIELRDDTYLLWVGMHGLATLSKPSRDDYLRLGPIDREAVLRTLVERLAVLPDLKANRTGPRL